MLLSGITNCHRTKSNESIHIENWLGMVEVEAVVEVEVEVEVVEVGVVVVVEVEVEVGVGVTYERTRAVSESPTGLDQWYKYVLGYATNSRFYQEYPTIPKSWCKSNPLDLTIGGCMCKWEVEPSADQQRWDVVRAIQCRYAGDYKTKQEAQRIADELNASVRVRRAGSRLLDSLKCLARTIKRELNPKTREQIRELEEADAAIAEAEGTN